MTSKFQLIISYDGTRYFGWQKTKTGPSIQETLEKAIGELEQQVPLPEAASRTDRGVHAEGQSVAIVLKKRWEEKTLQKALNHLLPSDIRVVQVKNVSSNFHPTLDAAEKEYHYYCCLNPVQEPIYRLYSWHIHQELSLDRIREGGSLLLGTHDFTALANAPKNNPICRLSKIEISPLENGRLKISIRGDRFLYNMARNIVGTLVAIGQNKRLPQEIPSLLASRDRKQAAITAPAHGLILHHIAYNF